VTGGNAGVGFELCKILYGSGATIHGIKIGGKSPVQISLGTCLRS
jgi:NAD(P)-dependent dehydrogenase (short-subunit alcohol dehydrogenase family)